MCFKVVYVVLFCVVFDKSAAFTSEELSDIADSCCSHGETFAMSRASPKCSETSLPEDWDMDKEKPCRDAARSCCDNYVKLKNDCAAGLKLAESKRCSVPKTDIGKTCCEECSLGKWTGESQGRESCGETVVEGVSPNTMLRKNAFHQCCLEAVNRPETTPKPIPTTTPKKIATTTEKRESCQLTNPCQHVCNDDFGRVSCRCREGYRLQGDKKSCKDINECAEALDDLCTAEGTVCHNVPGTFKCVPLKKRDTSHKCPPGFKMNVALQVCDDINECKLPRPPCPVYLCVNTVGGYKCGGVPGKPVEEGGEAPPPPPPGSETEKADMCPAGFRASGNGDDCVDIDECAEGTDECARLSQHCINRLGGFFCQDHVSKRCAPGFKPNAVTHICEDIDECADEGVCKQNEICVNQPGAYDCKSKISTLPKLTPTKTCQEGMRIRPGSTSCEDIDECREGSHLCDQFQHCINTYGGHECRCKSGFELDAATSACIDINECTMKLDDCKPGLHCINVLGSFTCSRSPPPPSADTPPPSAGGHSPDEYEYYYSDEDEEPIPDVTDEKPRPAKPYSNPTTTTQPIQRPVYTRWSSVSTSPNPVAFNPKRMPTTPKPVATTPKYVATSPKFEVTPKLVLTTPQQVVTTSKPVAITPKYVVTTPKHVVTTPKQVVTTRIHVVGTTWKATTEKPEPWARPNYFFPPPPPLQPPPNWNSPPPQPSTTLKPENRRTNVAMVDVPKPVSPEIMEKERGPNDTVNINVGDLPMNKWTNLVGRDPVVDTNEVHCQDGYETNVNGECVDTNECLGSHMCSSQEQCRNHIGGYSCECAYGLRRDPTGYCVPASPPATPPPATDTPMSGYNPNQPSVFNYPLIPTPPPATDTPMSGYRPSQPAFDSQPNQPEPQPNQPPYQPRFRPNLASTEPTILPVSSNRPIMHHQARTYRPQARRPWSRCDIGYRYDRMFRKCVDIDECKVGKANCMPDERCVNNDGGYNCVTNTPAPRTEISPSVPANPSAPITITSGAQYGRRGPKFVQPTRSRLSDRLLVSCAAGYTLTGDICADIDECATLAGACGPQQACENTFGGYTCRCPRGMALRDQDQCEDIDECAIAQPCPQNSKCVNTEGSFSCACDEGFRTSPNNALACVDVDECTERTDLCEHSCYNMWGTYRCGCKVGYKLGSDNSTCEDIDECAAAASGGGGRQRLCVGECVNSPGSYRCQCPKGYRIAVDSYNCIDINECENGEARCASDPSSVCVNTAGGYHCHQVDCPVGYRLEGKHRCQRIQRMCLLNDWECLRKPSAYTYNFIALANGMYIAVEGVHLFTMYGRTDDPPNFELKLISVKAPAHVKPVDLACFNPVQAGNACAVSLLCSLAGPQVAELELTMSVHRMGQFAGSTAARIIVIVSEYEY